jgi:D-glycero-alpha-D-manno-heptose-7-phosphate kinase
MLICRAPLRVSLFGGGTDFPSWYNKNKGAVISFAINKYCYTIIRKLNPIVQYKYRLRYFKNELVFNVNDIKHRSIKAILKSYDKSKSNFEIVHSADLPALSGLGSSSAFTVSLIRCIFEYNGVRLNKFELAKRAIHLEQNILKDSIGSQDQLACSFGGLNYLDFSYKSIKVEKLKISKSKINNLLENSLIIYTGHQRKADPIEKDKLSKMNKNYSHFKSIYTLCLEAKKILLSDSNNYIEELSRLMNESWEQKKKLSKHVSNTKIDGIYNYALKNGALGGKLLGAGSGGFIFFFTNDKNYLIKKLKKFNPINLSIDNKGCEIIHRGDSDKYI